MKNVLHVLKVVKIVKNTPCVKDTKNEDSCKDVDTSKLTLEEAKKLYEEGKISKGELDDVAIRLHEQKTHDELDDTDIDELIAEEYEAIADYEEALKVCTSEAAKQQLTHILEEEKEHVRELEELKQQREVVEDAPSGFVYPALRKLGYSDPEIKKMSSEEASRKLEQAKSSNKKEEGSKQSSKSESEFGYKDKSELKARQSGNDRVMQSNTKLQKALENKTFKETFNNLREKVNAAGLTFRVDSNDDEFILRVYGPKGRIEGRFTEKYSNSPDKMPFTSIRYVDDNYISTRLDGHHNIDGLLGLFETHSAKSNHNELDKETLIKIAKEKRPWQKNFSDDDVYQAISKSDIEKWTKEYNS